MGNGGGVLLNLQAVAELFHETLHTPRGGIGRDECLEQIPGQAGAHKQQHKRTPKRVSRCWAQREPWLSHQMLETGGCVDLRLAHGFDEEATPKGVAKRLGDLEERTTGGFLDKAGTGQRIGRRMTDEQKKPGCEKPQGRKAQRGERAVGALLDTKGQVDAEGLITGRSASREGKQGRNGSCLEKLDLAGWVTGPLDILWGLIQRLNTRPKRCQRVDLRIRETGISGRGASFDLLGPPFGNSLDHHLFVAQAALDNLTRHGLYHKMIRVGRAGDNGLSQARIGIDHDFSPFPSQRIGGEEDTSHLCLHHPLHHDGQTHASRINAQVAAVLDGAIRPQRRKTPLDGNEHRLNVYHVEKTLLLSGKGSLWQIFRGRGRTDRDRNGFSGREGLVRSGDSLDHLAWQRGLTQGGADGGCHFDLAGAVLMGHGHKGRKSGVKVSLSRHAFIGSGGDAKACWHGEASMDQFAQVRGFSSSDQEPCSVERLQRDNESAVIRWALIVRRECLALPAHIISFFLSMFDLLDDATSFGAKRRWTAP